MATWTTLAQLANGTTLALNATDHIWLNGTVWGNAVIVGNYQDSTHVSDVNDIQRDLTASVNNTKFLTASSVSLNSAGSAALSTLTSGNAPLNFNFTNASSVSTTAASFYAYDGVTDSSAMSGITFQAAEVSGQGVGTNSSWTAANGSGSALSIANHSAATNHNYYVAVSASPTANGAKAGSVKLTLTFA